jgi:hypothetical protein
MSNQSLEQLLALANQAAEVSDDMNEAVKGGGGGRLLPEGYAFGTFCEYIEFGQQPQEYKGAAKEPSMEIQLGFALTGQGYSNEDGTPYIMRTYPMALSRNEKANLFLLFKTMNWKGTAKHFAQLLGQHFLIPIFTKQPGPTATAGAKPRSQMNLKGMLPPLDPVTKSPYPIAAVRPEDLKLFLWTHPVIETWASFYQEGKYDDGGSKNKIQEKMLSALDFHGSPLHLLLTEKQVPFTIPAPKAAAPKPAAPAAPAGPAPAAPAVAMPAVPAAIAPAPAPAAVAPPFENGTPIVSAPAVAVPTSAAPAVPAIAVPAPAVAAPSPVPASLPAVAPAAIASPTPAVAGPAVAAPSLPAMPAMPAMPMMPA